ncbi:MAG: aminoacetone oxidase family FAD-binding enzyme [Rhodobacterales bacterium]|nr:MAG: aminoacetone oxidase family FAD-binding enzyme [Rhodobacterales bacterium]
MTQPNTHHPTLIIGAGAAGLFAAARTGPGTLVLDHAAKPAEKVRISGGGRCNFTNLGAGPDNYLGENPHFPKSALARYTPRDFTALLARHGLSWHEKTLGQLFCDQNSGAVIAMLLDEARAAGAALGLSTTVRAVEHRGGRFCLATSRGALTADRLVIATGGRSIPKMGATGFAHDLARQFGHRVTALRPGLVPLTFGDRFAPLAGLSLPVRVSTRGAAFEDQMLFTHRGLSGPAILQISSFWREGEAIGIDLLPGLDIAAALRAKRQRRGRQALTTALGEYLPARLVAHLEPVFGLTGRLADQSDKRLATLGDALKDWRLTPTGTEGWRTAEVTLGGVATDELSSKTMESSRQPGLYFIGEAVDVTGWLGGYNFHWAWASAHAAGMAIAAG